MDFPAVSDRDTDAFDHMLRAAGGPVVIIDALFGIGLTRALEGLEPLFKSIKKAGDAVDLRRVSVDVPSGLTDDGPVVDRPYAVFAADLTVTFHALKMAHRAGASFCGHVVVKDIGL
jgi:NAD(P)H-hydrate epimerase